MLQGVLASQLNGDVTVNAVGNGWRSDVQSIAVPDMAPLTESFQTTLILNIPDQGADVRCSSTQPVPDGSSVDIGTDSVVM